MTVCPLFFVNSFLLFCTQKKILTEISYLPTLSEVSVMLLRGADALKKSVDDEVQVPTRYLQCHRGHLGNLGNKEIGAYVVPKLPSRSTRFFVDSAF